MIIDASVLAKLFSAEEHSQAARDLVSEATEIFLPAHALAELAEILVRKSRLGEVTMEQTKMALGVAIRLVQTVPLNELLVRAVVIAHELDLSVYDTLYLALAEARAETLVTWDKRLLRRVQTTPLANLTRPLAPWTP